MKIKTIWILGILLISIPLVIAYQISLTQDQEEWLQDKASLLNQSSEEYLKDFISNEVKNEISIELQIEYNELVERCRQDNTCMQNLIPLLIKEIQ